VQKAVSNAVSQIPAGVVKLTVLSRSYCHLCDDLIAALEAFRAAHRSPFEIDVVDVDEHAELEAQWGDKVPVLLHGDDEICHYFFDESKLRQHLQQSA
jgi:glutaredoxin